MHRLALERAGMGERIVEYDLIRVVAIVLVVLIHVLSPFFNAGAVMLGELDVVKLLSREIRFVVPMYVVLTGALVWGRAAESARHDWRVFFVRRARSVLVPYLVWSAFFMLFTPVNELASPESMRLALRGVVLGSTWYHLYFVPIILGVYALTPVVSVALRRMGTSGGAIVFLLSLVVGIVTPVEVARSGLQDRAFMALVVLIASYLPYAALGAWYSTVCSSSWGLALAQRGWVPLLVAGAVLRGWFGAVVPWPTTPYAAVVLAVCMNLLQCLALLLLARVFAERWPHRARLATPWASVVLGVYLAHPLLIKLLYPLVDNGILPPAVWVATVWPAVTVACFTGVRALSKYRSLWWVHGVAPR